MHAFETSDCTGNSTVGVRDTRAGSRPMGLRSPFLAFKGCTRIGNLVGGVVGKVLGSIVGNPMYTLADEYGDNAIQSVYICPPGKDQRHCLINDISAEMQLQLEFVPSHRVFAICLMRSPVLWVK